ncbi:MAG: LamG domain-containing protein [Deltaproteobacteria bacterium]
MGQIERGRLVRTTYVDPLVGNASQLANQWVHVAGVVDRTAQTFTAYANGALAQSLPITGVGSLDNNLGFAIGRPSNGAFKGLVDEVRIYPRALPPEWIAAEYANLATPSFEAFGAEEMR